MRNNPAKELNQKIYLEALETLSDCSIIYGHYQSLVEQCKSCGHTYLYSNEKMTDVNIAVALMEDAFFPPNRFNISVKEASKGCMTIGRKKLKDAQFPDRVVKKDGFVLEKPGVWV